ncbi:MAG: efflux RND transporter periplasmic adaptor subunit [candidate division Zixibacteria bacterium]|nr:efflux RND transporter periplasmic adaptor subunit [candidate division Zixibacteria bacterium]
MKTGSLLIITGLSVLAITGCQRSDANTQTAAEGPPKPVVITVAGKSPGSQFVEQMGTVTARQRAGIETKIQAQVQRISVALGTHVRKGDLLVELHTRDLRAHVDQAQAVLQQVSQDYARYKRLFEQGAVTQQDYEAAKMQQSVAEAALAETQAMLSYAQITAPFAGTITEKSANVGDLAVPGRPLFVLEDDAPRQLVVGIPETYRLAINPGDSVPVAIAGGVAQITGVVGEISPSADPASRTFTAKIDLPAGANVRPGQIARLMLKAGGSESVAIPLTALVHRGQLELVFVATPESRANLRLVRTGRLYPNKVEILAGLNDGDRIVNTPPAGLADGDRIEERP